MEIKSLSELVQIGKLENDDLLLFKIGEKTLRYRVYSRYLSCIEGPGKIFLSLGLNKISFCNIFYTYSVTAGDFPECNTDDYKALYRVAVALFVLCEASKKKDTVKLTTEDGVVIEMSKRLWKNYRE